MAIRAIPMLLVTMLAATLVGCGGDHAEGDGRAHADPPPPPLPWFTSAVDVTDVDGVRSDAFWLGDTVRVWIRITNLTASDQLLRFPTTPFLEYGIDRADTGTRVWRWSDGLAIDATGSAVDFRPYETRAFWVDWDQRDAIGVPVAPGAYDVDAWIPSLDGSSLIDPRPALRIDLVAPPTS